MANKQTKACESSRKNHHPGFSFTTARHYGKRENPGFKVLRRKVPPDHTLEYVTPTKELSKLSHVCSLRSQLLHPPQPDNANVFLLGAGVPCKVVIHKHCRVLSQVASLESFNFLPLPSNPSVLYMATQKLFGMVKHRGKDPADPMQGAKPPPSLRNQKRKS